MNASSRRPRARRAFTMLELVIVLATLAVLTAVVSPPVVSYVHKSRFQEVVDDLRTLETAMVNYYADTGSLKPLEDIAGFADAPDDPVRRHFVTGDGTNGWSGPYLADIRTQSSFGGTYDIDVVSPSQAVILLGTRSELDGIWPALMETVNEVLDGDGDLLSGVVWGDDKGLHYGFNYAKP